MCHESWGAHAAVAAHSFKVHLIVCRAAAQQEQRVLKHGGVWEKAHHMSDWPDGVRTYSYHARPRGWPHGVRTHL